MNIREARELNEGDIIVDTHNNHYHFIALDKEKDLIVMCQSSVKGYITLLRIQCMATRADGHHV